jgi:hypothetical protein
LILSSGAKYNQINFSKNHVSGNARKIGVTFIWWFTIDRLREFLEMEARSGSMDSGCITPLYVYRMWGGSVAIEDIATGLKELRKTGFMEIR